MILTQFLFGVIVAGIGAGILLGSVWSLIFAKQYIHGFVGILAGAGVLIYGLRALNDLRE